MADEEYEVDARLELNAQAVSRSLNLITRGLNVLQGKIGGSRNALSGLVGQAIAFGGAYFGVRAMGGAMKAFAREAFNANSSAEGMRTALAAVYSAVEKVSFAKAQEDAGALFTILEDMAVQSPATGAELFEIFQGVYGPIRAAGVGLQDILTLTQNAASAATALGVDFGQAQRDISIMARGLAGMDVKTFSLLQSMGLIKETTEEWNALAPDKRAARLMEVMGQMGGEAAEAYGRTWIGLSSTFRGIMQQFQRVFSSAIFEKMKGVLEQVNTVLLENREQIAAVINVLGQKVAGVFTNLVGRATAFFADFDANMDAVATRLDGIWARFEQFKAVLITGAKVAAALQVASFGVGTVAPIVSALISGVSALAGVVGAVAGAIGSAGIVGALSAAGGAILAFAAPLAIAAGVVAALVMGFLRFKDTIMKMLAPLVDSFKSIGSQVVDIFKDVWAILGPPLEFLGGAVIVTVIAGFRLLATLFDKIVLPILRAFVKTLRFVSDVVLKPVFAALNVVIEKTIEAFEWLADKLSIITDSVGNALGRVSDALDSFTDLLGFGDDGKEDRRLVARRRELNQIVRAQRGDTGPAGPATRLIEKVKQVWADAKVIGRNAKDEALAQLKAPTDRPKVVNDFRGSKIEVKQEFREADPDRVWIQMRDALEREAVSRTQSGFASAFSR